MGNIEDNEGSGGTYPTQAAAIQAAAIRAAEKSRKLDQRLQSSGKILHAKVAGRLRLPKDLKPEVIEIKALSGNDHRQILLQRDASSGLYALVNEEQPRVIRQGRQPQLMRLAEPSRSHRPIPIKARVYADSNDAVQALELVKALTDFLDEVGYGKVKITAVTRGSVVADFKAWWNGDESQPTKKKMSEIGMYGEQWAKDVTANKARAEVASINANTTATLLASVEKYETIAMLIDDFLVIKYNRPDGSPFAFVKKLSIKEMRMLEENSAILADPNTVLSNLNLLSYAKQNDIDVIDSDQLEIED